MRLLAVVLLTTALLFPGPSTAGAAPARESRTSGLVQPAPDFTWLKSGGQRSGRREFLGRPVIILVAPSPRDRAFRAQVSRLQRLADRFGNIRTVMVAAFTAEDGRIGSNMPFVKAADPAALAAAYGVSQGFAIFILGRDGNIDAASDRVLAGQRVLDIINNSYVIQRDNRRG